MVSYHYNSLRLSHLSLAILLLFKTLSRCRSSARYDGSVFEESDARIAFRLPTSQSLPIHDRTHHRVRLTVSQRQVPQVRGKHQVHGTDASDCSTNSDTSNFPSFSRLTSISAEKISSSSLPTIAYVLCKSLYI